MSLERYIANDNLRQEVERSKKAEQTLVGALGFQIAADATIALKRQKDTTGSPLSSVLTLDNPDLDRNDTAFSRRMEALVYWGITPTYIEELVRSGTYDHEGYVTDVNLCIGKYGGRKIANPVPVVIQYGKGRYKKLIELAQRDRTLTRVGLNRGGLLPNELVKLWERRNVLGEIDQLLPEYRAVAKKVLHHDTDPHATRLVQLQNLHHHDLNISSLFPGPII